MKTLKQFLKFLPFVNSDKDHVVIPFPIHFKDQGGKDLKEEVLSKETHGNTTISHMLHNATASDLSSEASTHIRDYTDDSRELNERLIKGFHPLNQIDVHNTIVKHAKPSGHEVVLHSGTKSIDFSKLAKQSKDGILHSPAHISATHSISVANNFARADGESKKQMIHIHVKPTDKILHVSHHSSFGMDEHETIIPAGTKLKYLHSSDESNHHFEIHSQETKVLPPASSEHIKQVVSSPKATKADLRDALNNSNATPKHASIAIDEHPEKFDEFSNAHVIKPHHISKMLTHVDTRLTNYEKDNVLNGIANSKAANAKHLHAVALHPNALISGANYSIVSNPNTSSKTLSHILAQPNVSTNTKSIAAQHKNFKDVDQFVHSKDHSVIKSLLLNQHLKQHHVDTILSNVSNNNYHNVSNIAKHPLGVKHADDMIQGKHTSSLDLHAHNHVMKGLLENPKIKSKHIESIMNSPNAFHDTTDIAIAHKNLSHSAIHKLVTDNSNPLRAIKVIKRNPSVTLDHLKAAVGPTSHPAIAQAVLDKHGSTYPELHDIASHHPDEGTRKYSNSLR